MWIDVEDFDTGDPHDDYSFGDRAGLSGSGQWAAGKVGDADTYLFDAADLVRYAISWLEERFGI